MNWGPVKRVFRFPPTFEQNLVVLITAMAGIILLVALEWLRRGLSFQLGLGIALLAALCAAGGMLIYQERRSWALLEELRTAIRKIAPKNRKNGSMMIEPLKPPGKSPATAFSR